MNTKRKIAIVLWIIQAIALFGGFVNEEIFEQNIFGLIGFCFPGLIGVVLWFSKNKQKRE